MKNFNKSTFIISTIVFGLLLIPSFLAAFGEDEGTLPIASLWTIFAKLFYVLRFPTHTLLWTVITSGGADNIFYRTFYKLFVLWTTNGASSFTFQDKN